MTRLLATVAAALVMAPSAVAADGLTAHDKAAITIVLYSRSCADCDFAPDMATARWRFASDFGMRGGLGVAYALVAFRDAGGKRHATLFGFEPYAGRWRLLLASPNGSATFQCGSRVVLNRHVGIDRQLRLVKRLVRCA